MNAFKNKAKGYFEDIGGHVNTLLEKLMGATGDLDKARGEASAEMAAEYANLSEEEKKELHATMDALKKAIVDQEGKTGKDAMESQKMVMDLVKRLGDNFGKTGKDAMESQKM